MSAQIRAALGRTDLTPIERILLGVLASHDRDVFNPSMDVLAVTLYGEATRRTREETRQVMQRLENKGAAKRIYQQLDNGADTYSHIWIESDGELPSPQTGSDGELPSSDGRTPSSDGRTPGPKSKRAKKTKPAAKAGAESGEGLDMNDLAKIAHDSVLERFGVEIKPIAWIHALDQMDFLPMEIGRGLAWFFNEREDNILDAKNPGGYVIRTFPVYVAENIEQIRESLIKVAV